MISISCLNRIYNKILCILYNLLFVYKYAFPEFNILLILIIIKISWKQVPDVYFEIVPIILIIIILKSILMIVTKKKINDYFIIIRVPFSRVCIISQNVNINKIRNKSCIRKTIDIVKSKSDIAKVLNKNKLYVAITHMDIIDQLNTMSNITLLEIEPWYINNLNKEQKQLFNCTIDCEKFNKCEIRHSGMQYREFSFIKFKFND